MIDILFEINNDGFPKDLHIEHIEYAQEVNQHINLSQEAMSMAMEFAIEKLGISYSDFGLPEDENEEFKCEFICKINNQIYKVGYSSTYYYDIEEIKINKMNKEITIGELNDIYQKYGDLGFKVETPYGYKDIEWCGITEENADVYRCELENGMFVEGADYHRLKKTDNEFVVLKEIKVGEMIQTNDGDSAVASIELLKEKDTLYDIQVAEVHQYYTNGIVSHNTTLTIDAVKFLLHGNTTKTDKNEEIFNTFNDKNELIVRGMVDVEGDEIIIERKMNRSAKKSGGWNVVNKVKYFQILPDGTEKEQEEEDAKKTTIKIRETIGSEKDFEMLVLATEKNLDDLIGLTTSESGKLLSRLIGLEILEIKEAAVREMYNEFSRKKKSNDYDVITLTNEIVEHENKIKEGEELDVLLKERLDESKTKLQELNQENDKLLNSKEKIDVTISAMNPSKLQSDVDSLTIKGQTIKAKISELTNQISEMGEIIFDEDLHYTLTRDLSTLSSEKAVIESNIKRLKSVINDLINGGICQSCNRKLDNVDNTEHINKHQSEIESLTEKLSGIIDNISNKSTTLNELSLVKSKIDIKNRLELDKDRLEVEIGSLRNEVVGKMNDLKKYNLNLEAIEHNKNVEIMVSRVKTEIIVYEKTKDDTITKIERVSTDIKSNRDSILTKEKLIQTLNKEAEIEKIFKVYIELVGKKGISKLVLRSVLPIINAEVQRLLDDVCDFEVEIFIDDKNDVQFLINKDDTSKLLKSASGFEKTASSLALRATLGKMSTLPMPNFITFDEVLGKVAADNLEKLKTLFDKIKDMYDIVFLITHNDLVKDWSENLITINKVDNISTVTIK